MPRQLRLPAEIMCLVVMLALAAYLRLMHNSDNPSWYSDEGSNLEVAYHLQQGRLQYMALGQSTLLVSRLPLFEAILAIALTVFGGGIQTLRSLTGLLGTISVGLIYFTARQVTGKAVLASLAGLFLAIYPQAVLYSRFGFRKEGRLRGKR